MSESKQQQGGLGSMLSLDNKYVLALCFVVLLIILYYLRIGLMGNEGLFEPDGFFYYTAIKQAIANNFFFQNPVQLSGYPWHNNLGEESGLLYFVIVPYFFLRFFGISAYTVMTYSAIGAGAVIAALSYLLAKRISNSRALGLLAFFFVATSSGNIARTAGTVFRGDTFVSIFVLAGLLALLEIYKAKTDRQKYIFTALAVLAVSSSYLFWTGGSLANAVYLFAATMILAYAFVIGDVKVARDSVLAIFGGVLAFLLQKYAYTPLGLMHPGVGTGSSFYYVLLPVFVGALLAWYVLREKKLSGSVIFSSWVNRLILLGIGAVIAFIVVASSTAIPFLNVLNGVNAQVATTTQELQPPTFDFLWASNGLELYLAPLGVLLFLFMAHKAGHTRSHKIGGIPITVNYGFLVVLGYLLVTAYLQSTAIRYNALVSVPVAIFSAWFIYGIGKYLSNYMVTLGGTKVPLHAVFVTVAVVILIYQFMLTSGQTMTSQQADGVNPQFLSAMTWLSNNTASNATVLALWPDGSVVEAWGNRQSYMDSVGGENGTRIAPFAQFLFNSTPDSRYLLGGTANGDADRPQYFVARNFWFAELAGIAIEGNITTNLTNYGFDALNLGTIGGNATDQVYQFAGTGYNVDLVMKFVNNSRSINAYIGNAGTNQFVEMKNVLLVNATNENYTLITNPSPSAQNYTLLVTYVGDQIQGATLLGPSLMGTNLFKFLVLCGMQSCPYGDKNVTAQMVFQNQDTKIFRFIYH